MKAAKDFLNSSLALCFYLVCASTFKTMNCHTVFSPDLGLRMRELERDMYFKWLISDLSDSLLSEVNCLTVITDSLYHDSFNQDFYSKMGTTPIFKVLVKDYDDLLSPKYETLSVLKQSQQEGCNGYIILIANADQASRLLRFGDRYRVIDTRARFVLLYDERLFKSELHYLWKKIINVIFIRKFMAVPRFELSTVPFPAPIDGFLIPLRLDTWRSGKFQARIDLFREKAMELENQTLRIVTFEHMPSAIKKIDSRFSKSKILSTTADKNNGYDGLEMKMLQSLSVAMNFKAVVYEAPNSDIEAWGRKQINGSYSGLVGEVVSGRAEVALGNLHYVPYNLAFYDLSIPYTTQCFTFATPESTEDNSWKTLILPFKLNMWIAILLTLLTGGFLFFFLARFHKYQEHKQDLKISNSSEAHLKLPLKTQGIPGNETHIKKRNELSARKELPEKYPHATGLFIFEELDNSILYTYGMLLLVSLPRIPSGWAIRMLTGWWWLYCLLVVVSYRASMTAILARPTPRVTIDTLDELAVSPIKCGGWGEQSKEFFLRSLDSSGRRVGRKFEVEYNPEVALSKVTQGNFAYYENIYFLRSAIVLQKLKRKMRNNSTEGSNENYEPYHNIHIMSDCVINMPISIGLQKNSPLKPKVDVFVQRIVEAGLVKKWLADTMRDVSAAEAPLKTDEVKALMDLRKLYGGLLTLLLGYTLSFLALIYEKVHWHFVVTKNPQFDKYKILHYYQTRKLTTKK